MDYLKDEDDQDDVGNLDRDEKDDEARGPTLQVEIQATNEDGPDLEEDDEENDTMLKDDSPMDDDDKEGEASSHPHQDDEEEDLLNSRVSDDSHLQDPVFLAHLERIKAETPKTDLEIAYAAVLNRKEQHIGVLVNEISKLKSFISKRKQSYKRKRKEEGAPTRALSAYNIFVQDSFARLAKENAAALKNTDTNIQMQRVPPANLVASTGNAWKALPPEEKAKYEERAKADRKRYENQMAKYQPPDKQTNRKRNKTGYNMFFSAHVLRLKQSEMGVPSERGSVARLVGNAWKALTAEEKQYYEREADKHNGMNPVDPTKEDEDEDDEIKGQQQIHFEQATYAAHDMTGAAGYAHIHQGMHPTAPQHDPRHHGYYYAPQHGYYDYTATHHHQQHGRSRGHQQYQYPPQQGHGYMN